MRREFNSTEFNEEVIRCSKCGWEGSGVDANIVDFYGLTKVKDVHCPSCDSFLGGLRNADRKREGDDRSATRYGGDPLSNQFG